MELLTKMEFQKYAVEQIDEMFAASDLETFQNILCNLADKVDGLPVSRWHSKSYFECRILFWKEHLPAWMNWKYAHGHPLELRWLTVDMKQTFCHAISSTALEGPQYERVALSKLIEDKAKQLV